MKSLDHIPTHKIERAGKLVTTGLKIGGNYLKYYGKKVVDSSVDRSSLDQDNAKDIYDGLKELKGSALKMAQMLSMEKNLMPQAYVEQFSLAQFSVPPLSGPLARKIIQKYLGAAPEVVFDSFTIESVNAASIGQVHRAEKNEKKLAVKIQYPGVSDSIQSDLSIVKPIAVRMFNLQGQDTDKYFREIEEKLLEETDYTLELQRSQEISEACAALPGLKFPNYYPEWSTQKILTMDWMEGFHIGEYVQSDQQNPEKNNRIGQALWDFYMFQMHHLRQVHADPHPGNFLVDSEGNLVVIDFGCVKNLPDDFYDPYFALSKKENLEHMEVFENLLRTLEILLPTDGPKEEKYFKTIFHHMMELFTRPFHYDRFDFGDPDFWNGIARLSEELSEDSQLRQMNGSRGSKHFLYINRTFFGLYNLLHDLKAEVDVYNYMRFV